MSMETSSVHMNKQRSYDGCSNCRERRIKCEIVSQKCVLCSRLDLTCDVGKIQLKWSEEDRGTFRKRIPVVKYPPEMSYVNLEDVDVDIAEIDDQIPRNDDTSVKGPFSVFRAGKQSRNGAFHLDCEAHTGTCENSSGRNQPTSSDSEAQAEAFSTCSGLLAAAGVVQSDVFTEKIVLEDEEEYIRKYNRDLNMLSGEEAIVEEKIFERGTMLTLPFLNAEHCLDLTLTGWPRLTNLGQFLLSNYLENFAPYLSIFSSSENVWCTLFRPRVMIAIGNVMTLGRTSHARLAILYSVLSSSAFSLCCKFSKDDNGFFFYNCLGERLHKVSKSLLARCLALQANSGKYKDLIASILTIMITESLRDNGQDRKVLLLIMQHLINLRLKHRPKVSHKAYLLHRTCAAAFLTTKAAGWFFQPRNQLSFLNDDAWLDSAYAGMTAMNSEAINQRIEDLCKLESRKIYLNYMEEPIQFSDYLNQYLESDHKGVAVGTYFQKSMRDHSFELTYSLPVSLAYLFKETVMLVCKIVEFRRKKTLDGGEPDVTNFFSRKCTVLEAALSNWRLELDIDPSELLSSISLDASKTSTREARRLVIFVHYTTAFHQAIILYYFRIARLVNPALMQNIVSKIIDNLEATMPLNVQMDAPISDPPIFPSFVGACEALETTANVCGRYESWFQYM